MGFAIHSMLPPCSSGHQAQSACFSDWPVPLCSLLPVSTLWFHDITCLSFQTGYYPVSIFLQGKGNHWVQHSVYCILGSELSEQAWPKLLGRVTQPPQEMCAMWPLSLPASLQLLENTILSTESNCQSSHLLYVEWRGGAILSASGLGSEAFWSSNSITIQEPRV